MAVYLALLRAINVGGHNRLPMADLKALCTERSMGEVQIYLQTGNLLFSRKTVPDASFIQEFEDALEARFAFRPRVLIRSEGELAKVIADNPFADQPEIDPKQLLVFFLETEPTREGLEALKSAIKDGEEIRLIGKTLYVSYHPHGIGKSKLTNAVIERKLGLEGSGRNWNSVTRLLELAGGF
ncbi:DUF1697 domain-containing protein [Kiloniella laminariae]|uniref:DUF1697 domain-containing protein n=1 Tax=Kiloniella laminariae TaxID=454162 RepID=UPI0004779091|nr:DUF1697 domain-containing protein [Kiloniella laminariae]